MTLLGEVADLLVADVIPHALIGAAALAVRGIARSTFDVDLILLKLYAGGTQDLWDVRELLRGADAHVLTEAVEVELRVLPAAMQAAWHMARS